MSDTQFPRRIVFHGLGALGVAAFLAGCGGDSGDGGSTGGSQPTSTGSSGSGGGPSALAETADIPVDGGIILSDQKIVITQPTAGDFKAFTAVCTHQGNIVTSVSDGEIHCAFHGSVYDAATGDNIGGPAPAPLAEIQIRVKNGKIFEA